MSMKKFLALMLALVMVFALAACNNNDAQQSSSGSGSPAPSDSAAPAPSDSAAPAPSDSSEPASSGNDAPAVADARVAMITDYGDITDQSFNQTTYEACKEYCEANNIPFSYYKPNGDNTAERVSMVDAAVVDGYNIIVMPGYAFGGTIVEAAEDYPDVKFIALDVAAGDILEAGVPAKGGSYDYTPDNWNVKDYYHSDNVYCAVYQEELCGYMAGYAAVKLGYTHLGYLGGMAVPAVMRYGYGYLQGIDAAAKELGNAGSITVEYVYGNQFYGDADITAYMDSWYSNGVEIVFACGGGIYQSAAEAAGKVDGKVIGVDVDQAGIIDAYGTGMTVTSAMKGLAPAVKDALEDIIKNGNWANYAGEIATLGLVSGDDPEANYVQIPMDSTQWADGKFTQADYKALVKGMFDGTIKVSNDISAMPSVSVTVNEYGNIK